jgi:leader peptidase (prepilin peptidase)/N-methyltransferase
METHTAICEASHGLGADPRLQTTDPALFALTLLRRPASVAGVLGLTLTFSVIAFLRFDWTPQLWALVPLLIALAVITVLDLRAKVIPDVISVPGIIYALLVAAFTESPALVEAVLGAVVGGGIILLVAVVSRGAIGGGDIKLLAMLGAAIGWQAALVLLAVSQLAAAAIALPLLFGGRAKRRDHFPVGAIISLLGALMLLGRS